ncbi:MAG: P-loop NTPase fold protein [Bacteroidota bacterium]
MKKEITLAEAAEQLFISTKQLAILLKELHFNASSDEDIIPESIFIELQDYLAETKRSFKQEEQIESFANRDKLPRAEWIFPNVNIYAAYVNNDAEIFYNYYLENNLWELHQSGKKSDDLRNAQIGDLFFLVSNRQKVSSGPPLIDIKAIGQVFGFKENKKVILTNWYEFLKRPISLYGSDVPKGPFTRLPDYTVEKLNEELSSLYPDIQEIIRQLNQSAITHLDKDGKRPEIQQLITSRLNADHQFWWLNIRPENWSVDQLMVNETVSYGTRKSNGDLKSYVGRMKLGDIILGYHASPDQCVKGIFQVVSIDLDISIRFELLYLFENQTALEEIRQLKSFDESNLKKSIQGGLRVLDEPVFIDIVNTTELKVGEAGSVLLNPSRIAVLSADSEAGEDYFGINKDVESFAKIISSESFVPPLAIALFGQWGTGKSFFMSKLREKIHSLTTSGNTDLYIEGVVPIHFNAWSYMDTNLWASLVTKIFEELQVYISGNTKTDALKHQVEEELNNKLELLKEERDILVSQKRNDEERLSILVTKEGTLESELAEKIKVIKSASLSAILQEVDNQFDIKNKLRESLGVTQESEQLKELSSVISEKYWKQPGLAIKELKSAGTFVREFFKGKYLSLSLFLIVSLLIVIAVIPWSAWFNNNTSIQLVLSAITIFLPVLARFKATFDKLRPYVKAFWKIKSEHEEAVKNALFEHEQTMEAIKIEIASKRSELLNVHEQITQLNSHIKVLDYKLENALTTQTLYSFIERRAKSDVYQKELGIVSMIRNDFKILSELFADKTKEEQHRDFRSCFSKPLSRIVLYIDDLDRCPEDRVIEVLEAVNLLMAFPLFVVVVGVDPRWVKNALIKKYHMQFTGKLNGEETGLEPIDATNYLEKIFQVPFHLKKASDDGVKYMLKELSTLDKQEVNDPVTDVEVDDPVIPSGESKPLDKRIKALLEEQVDDPVMTSDSVEKPAEQDDSGKKQNEEVNERFILSNEEVELIQSMSGIIGNNPRAIKRFVNVYHIVRAHEGLSINSHDADEYLILMFLLAFPMGPYKKLHPYFIRYMTDLNDDQSVLADFFSNDYDEFNKLKEQIRKHLDDLDVFEKIKDTPIAQIKEHNKFVQRFTFSELAL